MDRPGVIRQAGAPCKTRSRQLGLPASCPEIGDADLDLRFSVSVLSSSVSPGDRIDAADGGTTAGDRQSLGAAQGGLGWAGCLPAGGGSEVNSTGQNVGVRLAFHADVLERCSWRCQDVARDGSKSCRPALLDCRMMRRHRPRIEGTDRWSMAIGEARKPVSASRWRFSKSCG